MGQSSEWGGGGGAAKNTPLHQLLSKGTGKRGGCMSASTSMKTKHRTVACVVQQAGREMLQRCCPVLIRTVGHQQHKKRPSFPTIDRPSLIDRRALYRRRINVMNIYHNQLLLCLSATISTYCRSHHDVHNIFHFMVSANTSVLP